MGRASDDRTKCAHEPIEKWSAPEPGELEGERVRAAYFRLELHLVERRGEPLHPGDRGISKGNTGFFAAHQDALDPESTPGDAQECHGKHRLGGRGERTEAIAQLGTQRLDVVGRIVAREPLV